MALCNNEQCSPELRSRDDWTTRGTFVHRYTVSPCSARVSATKTELLDTAYADTAAPKMRRKIWASRWWKEDVFMALRRLAVCVVLVAALGCSRSPAAGVSSETAATIGSGAPADGEPPPDPDPAVPGSDSPDHDEFCRPERYEGFASDLPCSLDSDCVSCECLPVNRTEHARLGGNAYCERFNQPPAREECMATNPACCDGRCVLSR